MPAPAASLTGRSTRPRFWLFTLAFIALLSSAAAWADPPGRVGRIADTEGAVWLYDDEQGEWIQARRNRPVTEGDRLSVERGGRAEVQIGSATLRLDGGSEMEFMQLDDARVRVRLHGGSVALRTRGGDSAREFAVVTREGRFEPLRAGRYRIDVRDDASFGAALAGSLRFEAGDSILDLQAGQRAEFWAERGVTHYAWSRVLDDRFAEWVASAERNDDRDQQRERERRRYVSPEMTGAEDLDRYGNWDRHPEYGAMWYPTTVAIGWSPYRYGHWAYLRPWGYTWVDDAPWGFAPFHYGRWVNYGGRWGWCPGQYVARPVYAPALVGWFGGSNVSVGISIGGGSAVGWVPLAPREVYVPSYQVTNIYVRNVNVSHERWQPRERTVPTGPIMYTNQGVAGGVTVVPQAVMRNRQPISGAVALPVDAPTVAKWTAPAPRAGAAPVEPPTPRVVATPGGAVPAAPGAQRAAPWTRDNGPGQPRQAAPAQIAPPAQEQRPGMTVGRPPQAQAAPQGAVQPPAAPTTQRDNPRERAQERQQERQRERQQERREQQGERRMPVPPTTTSMAPVAPAAQAAPQVAAPDAARAQAQGPREGAQQGRPPVHRAERDEGPRAEHGRRDPREQQNR